MRFRRPVTVSYDFERHCAVKTFLVCTINHALTAAADLFQQFIVAKVGQRLCRTRSLFNVGRSVCITRFNIFNGAAVIRLRRGYGGRVPSGYRWLREETKACLKQAGCAKSFRRVGEDFRSALSTNSKYAAHYGRVARSLPILYCAEFYHTLRSQHSDQMAQLIFDIAGNGNSVADFLPQ